MSRRPTSEPYWSVGVYRFDAAEPERQGAFGVCYAASSLALAFAESVIHETGRFASGRYEVPRDELAGRSVVRFVHPRRKTIVFADLTGEALNAPGLNNDISATDDYTIPQAWARAIHEAGPRWEGIRYVSRQMNKGYAYALFKRSGLRKLGTEKLKGAKLDELCDRFNVAAV